MTIGDRTKALQAKVKDPTDEYNRVDYARWCAANSVLCKCGTLWYNKEDHPELCPHCKEKL